MNRFPITIVGDAYVEQFRPVLRKPTTSSKVGVPVYESAPGANDLHTESPGGAAFLASLLCQGAQPVQIAAPIQPNWPLASWMRRERYQQEPLPITLVPLRTSEWPSRVESFYASNPVAQEDDDERWQVQFRCDELHPAPNDVVPPLQQSEMLIVDDHARGAITGETIAGAKSVDASTIIVSAQYEQRGFYLPLLDDSAATKIVVCTERQALLWSGYGDPPTRFPPGSPHDHAALLAFIFGAMLKDLGAVSHIIINRSVGSLASFYFKRDKLSTDGPVRYFTPVVSLDDPESEGTPGVNTVYLAAFAHTLRETSGDVTDAIRAGVRAAVRYTREGIRRRPEGYFGRTETIGAETPETVVVGPNITVVNSAWNKVWAGASDFLKRAQLHGRLNGEKAVMDDYYAPEVFGRQITALLTALSSYVERGSKRPFNVLIEADPGAGKSYFAQCLSRYLDKQAVAGGRGTGLHPLLETNLSFAQDLDRTDRALLDLYEDIRDQRALGRVPIVLIDEFDTLLPNGPSHTKGHSDAMDQLFARMLAPLWDGVFVVDGRHHRLGGFILLIAASNPDFAARLRDGAGKARDFASRLDVRLDFRQDGRFTDDEKFESKVRVAVSMLKKHFGDKARHVQVAVLDAIGRADFPGRNRAIDQLVMMSSMPTDGTFRSENLPSRELWVNLTNNLDIPSSEVRYGESLVELS